MPEEKEDKGFKVIDRRGVEPPSPSPPPIEKPESAATEGMPTGDGSGSPPLPGGDFPPPADVHGETGGPGDPSSALGVPRFLDLVQSLQMGAMAGLGLLQGPDGKRSPVDLPAAKDAIDLLGVLQEKTKGNLTKEEEEILREGLYHLRMGYMAMINAPPPGRGKGGEQR
jgi:hypothetical protein